MASETNSSKPKFSSDVNFCPQCGSIMPLPGREDWVKCYSCPYQVNVMEFDGIEIKTKIVFNKLKTLTTGLTSDAFSGPEVDRKCYKCGNEGMTYSTRQTRSADEGQTVFYSCPKCGAQEQEYS